MMSDHRSAPEEEKKRGKQQNRHGTLGFQGPANSKAMPNPRIQTKVLVLGGLKKRNAIRDNCHWF